MRSSKILTKSKFIVNFRKHPKYFVKISKISRFRKDCGFSNNYYESNTK